MFSLCSLLVLIHIFSSQQYWYLRLMSLVLCPSYRFHFWTGLWPWSLCWREGRMKWSSWDAESSLALLWFFVLFIDLGSHFYLFSYFLFPWCNIFLCATDAKLRSFSLPCFIWNLDVADMKGWNNSGSLHLVSALQYSLLCILFPSCVVGWMLFSLP